MCISECAWAKEYIKKLNLPDLFVLQNGEYVDCLEKWEIRRNELKEILQKEEYGFFPPPIKYNVETEFSIKNHFSGIAAWEKLNFKFTDGVKEHTVPVNLLYPENLDTPVPFIIYMSFSPDIEYAQEIVSSGFGILTFAFKDVSSDSPKWDGLAPILCGEDKRSDTVFGKLALWSYMVQRTMDYLQTLDFVDKDNIAVMGHSRMGKCALLTAAFDSRFKFACINESGCGGAAITRGKGGENVEHIVNSFGYWFCPNFAKYRNREFEMHFDQHFLLSLVAPRFVLISAAQNDTWADTNHQFLNCVASDGAYGFYKKDGFIGNNDEPKDEVLFLNGHIGFALRGGDHAMTVRDLHNYLKFIKLHLTD